MMTAVTSRDEIAKCQRDLVHALHKHLTHEDTLLIGHQGASFSGEVHYNDDLWVSTHKITKDPIHRYWNGFGLKIQPHGIQNISVEINPPLNGYTARVSGLFAKDNDTGDYLLLHRGRIGGGRKGIGKNAFADWFRGQWVEVNGPSGQVDSAILVARLKSPEIVVQLLTFVTEVAKFKSEITSGRLTRKPIGTLPRHNFKPEFHGKQKGLRFGILEYDSFHGLVVNKLEEKVRTGLRNNQNANVFNTRLVDLGVEIGRQVSQLYEVKSSADLQSLYAAIGQLMFHSAAVPNITRTIVIPGGKIDSDVRGVISALGFNILEYRIRNGLVIFLP